MVTASVRNAAGEVVKVYAPQQLSADELEAAWFVSPVMELLAEPLLKPELTVSCAGKTRTWSEGLWSLSLHVNRSIEFRWVKQSLREKTSGVTSALAVSEPAADGTVTVSTTDELVEALNRYNGQSQVIQLESNDYVLPSEPMQTDANNGHGAIYINKVTLRGLGEKPEDVKLIGNGSIRAVLAAGSARLENLMITNGNTTAGYIPPGQAKAVGNSTRGGGVYGAGVITNCVITGCSGSHGGGVAQSTSVYCSHLYGNSSTYGGAVFNTSVYGSVLENNTAASGGAGWFNGASFKVFDSQILNNRAPSIRCFWEPRRAASMPRWSTARS